MLCPAAKSPLAVVESLREFQLSLGRYLRDPRNVKPPKGLDSRRLKIYEDLLFNNISGFVNGCFPVCRQVLGSDQWQALVRRFFCDWRCQTPYFHEIPQEFLLFLGEQSKVPSPPWLEELAHYEWVEMAVDTRDETLADSPQEPGVIRVNPTAFNLQYQWQVHLIDASFRPRTPQLTCLVVYRNKNSKVQFVEVSAATSLLISILERRALTRGELLCKLADAMNCSPEDSQFHDFANQALDSLIDQNILLDLESMTS